METQTAPRKPWTGIQVGTSFRSSWLELYLCTPTIAIDGHAEQRDWGLHTFPLDSGRHHLRIFVRYLFFDIGEASIDVVVKPNQVNRIVVKGPWFFFLAGVLSELAPYRFDNVEDRN